MQLNELGEPIYGPRGVPNLAEIAGLALPFWLAGSYADPARLQEALSHGATGIQVGTAFAFCEESGVDPLVKQKVIEKCLSGEGSVHTDPLASPTGFPFKVFQLDCSLSDEATYEHRERLCELWLPAPILSSSRVGVHLA